MPILFTPPPQKSPELQKPQAAANAHAANDASADAAAKPPTFASLLEAAGHPRPTPVAPASANARRSDAHAPADADDPALRDADAAPPLAWLGTLAPPGVTDPAQRVHGDGDARRAAAGAAADETALATANAAAAALMGATAVRLTPVDAPAPTAVASGDAAGVAAVAGAPSKDTPATPADRTLPRATANDVSLPALPAAEPKKATPDELRPAAATAPSLGDAPIAAPIAAALADTGASAPAPLAVAVPVGSAGWADDVAQKVAHVIRLRHETAELHVQPENLGPIGIRITMDGDQAFVQLTAAHAATREALENALPLLRDMLAHQGLNLGDAAVGGDGQSGSAFAPPWRFTGPAAPAADPATVTPLLLPIPALRLLDVFA